MTGKEESGIEPSYRVAYSISSEEITLLNEIKVHIKELLPQSESTPERIILERLSEISKRLQKSKTWGSGRKESGSLIAG
jgi:hypothetical protein